MGSDVMQKWKQLVEMDAEQRWERKGKWERNQDTLALYGSETALAGRLDFFRNDIRPLPSGVQLRGANWLDIHMVLRLWE